MEPPYGPPAALGCSSVRKATVTREARHIQLRGQVVSQDLMLVSCWQQSTSVCPPLASLDGRNGVRSDNFCLGITFTLPVRR